MQRNIIFFFPFLLTVTKLCAVAAQPVLSTDGRFDMSWGNQGRLLVDTDVEADPFGGASLLILPDRRLLLVGGCYLVPDDVLCAVRLRSNGSLDPGFGPDGTGRAIYDGLSILASAPPRVAMAADGSTFVGTNRQPIAVSRIGVDGTLQATLHFHYLPNQEFPWEEIDALAVQPDGKVLAAGFVATENVVGRPINHDFAVARLLPDLSGLDTSFGEGGVQLIAFDIASECTSWPCNVDSAAAMAIQPDGKIVLSGRATGSYGSYRTASIALARLMPDGALDAGFGNRGDGTAVYSLGQQYWHQTTAMALDAQGRILLTGGYDIDGGNEDVWIMRLMPDGGPDATFGFLGVNWLKLDLGGNYDERPRAIAVQCDGKVLIAGAAATGDLNDLFVARFRGDGRLDSVNFGIPQGWVGGTFLQPRGGVLAYVDAMADSIAIGNGGLMIAGVGSDTGGAYHFGVARLTLAARIVNGCH